MPYIDQASRDELDPIIEELVDGIPVGDVGSLNYAITSVALRWLDDEPISYASINAVIGVLECAKQEMYRRIAAPYEDIKCRVNGDVYL